MLEKPPEDEKGLTVRLNGATCETYHSDGWHEMPDAFIFLVQSLLMHNVDPKTWCRDYAHGWKDHHNPANCPVVQHVTFNTKTPTCWITFTGCNEETQRVEVNLDGRTD